MMGGMNRFLKLLRQHEIRLKKSLGQHLLLDGNLLEALVRDAELTGTEQVVEIGAGLGNLTECLAGHCRCLLAVEIDSRMAGIGRRVLAPYPHVEFLVCDGLEGDRLNPVLVDRLRGSPPAVWVSNLPYNRAATLVLAALESEVAFARGVFTVQKEVAERFAAEPGSKSYGPLSVLIQSMSDVEIIRRVPGDVFRPRPRVGSAVVRLRPRQRSWEAGGYPVFKTLVRASFRQRRRTLGNSLGGAEEWNTLTGFGMAQTRRWLESHGVDPSLRPEQLPLSSYERLGHSVLSDFRD
jgi:16S rRNA (adenine1518-N6/adenine1519-N6)-dimethyltransferase